MNTGVKLLLQEFDMETDNFELFKAATSMNMIILYHED